uniref:Glucan endo-1,3-beta-D-glucosidase n=1 Tax=Setaria viridis TaxID=4556 RepID=A0A4U6UQI8_SETVI|nr:hypothetical protein SEVIR_5G454601v2 [Setaria viridis]
MGAMGYVVAFLERTRAPLLANLYPYFVYTLGLGHMDMSFALFTSPETVVQDGEYGYQNLLEASVDALYTAVGKLGGSRVRVVVSEIGWPTAGGAAASVENAMTYNQNLVRHVWKGTPRRPRRREPQGRRRGAELGALLSKHGEGLPDHLRRLTSVDGLDTYIAGIGFCVYHICTGIVCDR